jgi:large subunit ribosomal protein L6
MSRIGKKAVAIPKGVTVSVSGQEVKAKGPKGELSVSLVAGVSAKVEGAEVVVAPRESTRELRAMWGLSRTLVQNLVTGVSRGYSEALEINGVGYRAQVQGKTLQLQLGYAHDIAFSIPPGIEIKCEKPTSITVSGIDKQKVGQVAAEIRAFRPPEPYKGKGVKYAQETIFRKEGKKK